MTVLRSICAVLVGASMLTNCTTITDNGSDADEFQAEQPDVPDALVVIDAPTDDQGRSYYAVRIDPQDEQRLWLQAFDDQDEEVSRLTVREYTDPDGALWFQVSLDDEQVSLQGHLRVLDDDQGRTWFELDAELDGQVVALRTNPQDPTDVQVYGFGGTQNEAFVPIAALPQDHPRLDRLVGSLARYIAVAPPLNEALHAPNGLAFRGPSCAACMLYALGALAAGAACLAAAVTAGAICAASGGIACGKAVTAASAACGVSFNTMGSHIDNCDEPCDYHDDPIVDPCAGGCSCPGGAA